MGCGAHGYLAATQDLRHSSCQTYICDARGGYGSFG